MADIIVSPEIVGVIYILHLSRDLAYIVGVAPSILHCATPSITNKYLTLSIMKSIGVAGTKSSSMATDLSGYSQRVRIFIPRFTAFAKLTSDQ
jgi:hypothetical protein